MRKYLIFITLVLFFRVGFSQSPYSRILLGQDTSTGKGGVKYYDTLKTLVCSGCTVKHGTYSDTITVTAAGSGNNMYNTDSTLSGTRTVQMSGRQITWTSTGNARSTLTTSNSANFALNEVLNDLGNGLQTLAYGSTASPGGLASGGDIVFQGNTASGKKMILTTNGTSPILFGINGVEIARFTPSGLGIGRTPTSALDVFVSAANSQIQTQSGLNTGQGYLSALNNSGNGFQGISTGSTFVTFGLEQANYSIAQGNGSAAFLIQTIGGSAAPIIFGVNIGGTPTEVARFNTLGSHVMTVHRFETAKGATVASANNLTLGSDGNVFHISGTTTINAITVADWQAGSVIHLIFDGSLTVKNNTAGGGGTAVMKLAGGVDFSATADDQLTLTYDGTTFDEMCRSVN